MQSNDMPFQLEFRQLKEYFNFRRKFKSDKYDTSKQNITIQDEYYLINRNWIQKWKQYVGFNEFCSLNLNRDVNDKDYDIFLDSLPKNINEMKLAPLDNSNIYNNMSEINPLAEFIIIDKKCHEAFRESSKKIENKIIERPIPLKFSKDKIILHIDTNIKIICFKDDITKLDMEIIIIFKKQKSINKILTEIDKQYFKTWLFERGFTVENLDEFDFNEQGCDIKIINKNLKIKNGINGLNFAFNNQNNVLINENQSLRNELNIYKIENVKLKSEINKLNTELMKANETIFNLNNFIQNNQRNNNIITDINNMIKIKDKEIYDLKMQLQQNNLIKNDKLVNYKDILVVHFISTNQKINSAIKCFKTETFAEVEERLYQKFPEFRETNNNFLYHGKMISRFKNMSENSFQDGEKIMLVEIE